MRFDDFKKTMLEDKEFREEYYKKDLAFEVGQMILQARAIRGISQKDLAVHARTKQPSIARVENGALPSLGFLKKLAEAMGTYLIPPRFGFMKDIPSEVYDTESSGAQSQSAVGFWPTLILESPNFVIRANSTNTICRQLN